MYTVLLSGGSGKRLWPLSNALRSKQYIKLLQSETNGACSMIQRVWGQLERGGLLEKSIICASRAQVEIIRNQLGPVGVAVEPERRDTFPAVALSCAYLKSRCNAKDEDVVCVIPVDPYAEQSYFDTLRRLPDILGKTQADVALMGARPAEPSEKYGYIVPSRPEGDYYEVDSFCEKPDEEKAARLIAQGALWNCGVFCLRIGTVLDKLTKYNAPKDYDGLYDQYSRLPKISFDYEVLEKAKKLVAVPFDGMWQDLGTWNALSEQMENSFYGNGYMEDSCKNTHVVNEMEIPVAVMGVSDLMVVASYDGILIADKQASENIKTIVDQFDLPPMYEERRWGTIKVLDNQTEAPGTYSMTRKIRVFAGQNLSYHYHKNRDEVWMLLEGRAEVVVGNERRTLGIGDSIRVGRDTPHSLRALTEVTFVEVQTGKGACAQEDSVRLSLNWPEIPAHLLEEDAG